MAEKPWFGRGVGFAAQECATQCAIAAATPELHLGETLTPHALATRLSYFVTGAPPDDALLDEADAGDIDLPRALARMIDSPEYDAHWQHFHALWLGYEGLGNDGLTPRLQSLGRCGAHGGNATGAGIV